MTDSWSSVIVSVTLLTYFIFVLVQIPMTERSKLHKIFLKLWMKGFKPGLIFASAASFFFAFPMVTFIPQIFDENIRIGITMSYPTICLLTLFLKEISRFLENRRSFVFCTESIPLLIRKGKEPNESSSWILASSSILCWWLRKIKA